MNSESIHKKTLDKILASQEFLNSKIYQTYLIYLVESAENARPLKETTIALEVFGRNCSFNPAEDTIVRSHTYTLRKKLETYYFNEGKDDKIRLKIPKGHYTIQFVPASVKAYHPQNILRWMTRRIQMVSIIILCGCLLGFGAWNLGLQKNIRKFITIDRNDPIWKDYLQSDLPVMLVIGNHFFFNEYSEKYNQTISIRHPKVNSKEDFQTLFPDMNLVPSPEPYFPYHSIWSLPPILSIFYSYNKSPILRKSSDVSPQMLDEYNIVFLGSIKTLYVLKYTLLKSHFRFEILPHQITYHPPDSTSASIFETTLHSEGPNEDLVLALKLPGPINNSIFIIASYHSLGAPEIAHYLTEPRLKASLLDQFQKKFSHVPRYFEILFRVSGIDKTAYKTEPIILNEISADNTATRPGF